MQLLDVVILPGEDRPTGRLFGSDDPVKIIQRRRHRHGAGDRLSGGECGGAISAYVNTGDRMCTASTLSSANASAVSAHRYGLGAR